MKIQMGMKGGFMLSTGCEMPLNSKIENIKTMMQSVKNELNKKDGNAAILFVCYNKKKRDD